MEALPMPVEEARKTVALLMPVSPIEPKVSLKFHKISRIYIEYSAGNYM